MGVKTAGVGHFAIPTAPAAGTSVTSGAANVFTTTAVQLIAATAAPLFITGVHLEAAAAKAATYIYVQLMIGAAGVETIVGQYLVPLSTASTVALGYRQIYPPIPVATGIRISAKTADSVGAAATLVTLECIAQSNVVDDAIPVSRVTLVDTLTTYTGNTPQTGDSFARLGAPVGASHSADVAAVKADTAANKVKTDFLPSAVAGAAGGLFIAGTNAATTVNFTGNLSGSVGSVTGAVGSVTGAVGSVTGNVGGNVGGSVASVTGAVGSVTGLTAANLDVAVSTRASAALQVSNADYTAARAAKLDNLDVATSTRLATAGYTAPDNAGIATNSAGVTTLTGRLTAGRALLLDNLDAAVSTRLAASGYVTPLDATSLRAAVGLAAANLDTQLSGISSKTVNLPPDPADASDIAGAFGVVNGNVNAVGAAVTGVQTTATAIKGKTDSLSFTVAGQVDVNLLSVKGHALTGVDGGPYG